MEARDAKRDTRLRAHRAIAPWLDGLSDRELQDQLAGDGAPWRASVHGSQSGVVELEGVKVFVKKISLTAIEQAFGTAGSTANLFGLPLFYQYGVGSSGFGAWRELRASLKASDWVLSGECPLFPLVHHWRVLPRTPPTLTKPQADWLAGAQHYWNGSDAVRARLDAIASAKASIVVVYEHFPMSLHAWRDANLPAGAPDAACERQVLRFYDQLAEAAAFMNARGMLHFDLHAANLLTDGEDLAVTDFGLALCDDFELGEDERAFHEHHRHYDRAYAPSAIGQWLQIAERPERLTKAIGARFEGDIAAARLLGGFIDALVSGSKATPFPAEEIAAAFAKA